VAGEAISRARSGGGPTLLECKTYRTRAHSEGMRDAGYRTQDEVNEWRARDPSTRLRDQLLADGIASEEEIARLDSDVQALIAEATEFAKNSPWPDAATATDHVFA
jgi:2-oxoisovalerate dehydrogenase E1 component